MAGTVKGNLYYQQNSYAGILSSRIEIVTDSGQYLEPTNKVKGICVTLYSSVTSKALSIATSNTGTFEFTNVPNGEYLLMETAGVEPQYTTGLAVDFSKASSVTAKPETSDPPISVIANQGLITYDANEIVSLTPNAFKVQISSTQTLTFDFIDAPRKSIPLEFRDCIIMGNNLVHSVDGGSFGTLPQTTAAGTSPASCPYQKYTTGEFTSNSFDTQIYSEYISYSKTTPDGGFYSICNIANKHTFDNRWFDTPGKKQGDETGRFLIVNGKNPGKYFFREKVTVKSGKDYLFTAWIMNIYRLYSGGLPLFKITVDTTSGINLYNKVISEEFPLIVTSVPTWKQIGTIIPATVINNNNELLISFISMGNEVLGNDYCVDEISFYELEKTSLTPTVTKAVDKSTALENEDIKYTLTIQNLTSSYIYDIVLNDIPPDGVRLSYNSIQIIVSTVNITYMLTGETQLQDLNISEILKSTFASQPDQYMNDPFYSTLSKGILPRILPLTAIFRFRVDNANDLSVSKKVMNYAQIWYKSSLDGTDPLPRSVFSNIVSTQILYPILKTEKQISIFDGNGNETILENGDSVLCGQTICYRIRIINTGTADATDVQITDSLDPENLIPIFSLYENCSNGVSIQQMSPEQEAEVFLPCSDIEIIDGSVHHIRISHITVPASGETSQGEIVLRIYCETVCD